MTLPDLSTPQPDVRIEALRLAYLDLTAQVATLSEQVATVVEPQAVSDDDRAALHNQADQQGALIAGLQEQVTALGA